MNDSGPWHSGSNRKEWFVESEDFTHDVRLTIGGDFSTNKDIQEYANWLAEQLNKKGA